MYYMKDKEGQLVRSTKARIYQDLNFAVFSIAHAMNNMSDTSGKPMSWLLDPPLAIQVPITVCYWIIPVQLIAVPWLCIASAPGHRRERWTQNNQQTLVAT